MKIPGLQSRRAKIGVATAAAYLIYFLFTSALGRWLELTGWSLWILRGGLWLLGLVAALLVFMFTSRGGKEEAEGDEDIDAAIAAARARLASARAAKGGALGKLPLVIVLGPAGSAKTASVVHCGLDPDLLAGDAVHADQIAPTAAVNCWYSQHSVILEAGGGLLQESNRWARFLEHAVPDRFRATVTGRAQARRVAVVCFSCEELLKPGAASAVPTAAHELRERLAELAGAIGISLPVYVLFTKADRIPHFPEFAHHLSREEVQLGLGETLRWPTRAPAGLHAERESQRVDQAFNRLFIGLAAGRLQLLARENETTRRGAVYEFPRELRKIAPLATQFLVELCRPSQLAVNAVLRGFYFSGVRAIVTSDVASPLPPAAAARGGGGATQVFDARLHQASARDVAPAGGRKVPQWLFLDRVFRDVILRDRAGDAMAQGGVHVNLWRRGLLATAASISLLWLLGMPVSCVNNGRLANRSYAAADRLRGVYGAEGDVPKPETLADLDQLRQNLETVVDHQRDGPPLRWRWGLYKGPALYDALREVYLNRLEAVLLRPSRASMVRALQNVPNAPQSAGDYGRIYSLLKAYLMTTSEGKNIEPAFLDSVLMDRWREGRLVDSSGAALVRQQFQFYARKLCLANPCGADEKEGPVVSRARSFLLTYAGPEQIYQAIVSEASKLNPPVQFTRTYPSAAAVLANVNDVPGAFTPAGWGFMRGALANPDSFFKRENWVLGAQARVELDRATLLATLRSMYDSEYVRRWAAFVASARLEQFHSAADAARKLQQLSGNESPLLQLFRTAAINTNVDSQRVGNALQPVHVVTPASITDRFVSDANKPYMDALAGLQAIVAQAAGPAPVPPEMLAQQALERASAARAAVAQLAQKFLPASAVGPTVQKLMEEPATSVERLLGNLPAAAANGRAAAFCVAFNPLRSKYPFNANSGVDATLQDVTQVFHQESGALAGLKNALGGVLVQQGTRFVSMPGGAIHPSAAFLDFFNRAAGTSSALWQYGPNEPRFSFSLKPRVDAAMPVVTVFVDGQVYQFTRTQLLARPYDWIGPRAREVRVTAQIRGREEVLLQYGGTWAVFKLFNAATWRNTAPTQLSGMPYILQWPIAQQGITLEMELNIGQAPPFLRKDYFAGMSCVPRVQ